MIDHNWFQYYDSTKEWGDDCPGWYEFTKSNVEIMKHQEMVDWIYEKLDKPEKHMRWMYVYLTSESKFKFRYERNYILFTLRWS